MPSTSKPLSFVPKDPCSTQDRENENSEHECNNLSAASTFSVGLRVLKCTSVDVESRPSRIGEGIAGTVTEIRLAENTAVIQWDTGTREIYHDPRQISVLDNSSFGMPHRGTMCRACGQCPISGLLWKCSDCKELCVDLCTSCYMNDKHDTEHTFLRFDACGKDGVHVESRSITNKIQVRGIYPDAKVTKGPDWQESELTKSGTVTEITSWQENPVGGVRVSWDSGSEGSYRLGYNGKVDLKCITASSGGWCYKSHLPRLGPSQQRNPSSLSDGNVSTSHCSKELTSPVSNITNNTVMQTSQEPDADDNSVFESGSQEFTAADWKRRGLEAKASRNELHKASICGNVNEVKTLLDAGEDVNQGDKFLMTPLHLASWYGRDSVVELLLERGANVNTKDIFQKTPLQKAERQNHRPTIHILKKHGATPSYFQPCTLKSLTKMAILKVDGRSGFNLLQAVVYEGNFEIVLTASIFLDNFAREINFESTANNAKTFPSKTAYDMFSTLKKNGHVKIKRFCEETLEKVRTLTELHQCGDTDDAEMAVELVLHHGLDINTPAKGNRTPLLWSALRCSGEFVKTLIELGAETNAQREDKCTPLIMATYWNNYMAVRLLTSIGVNTDVQQVGGCTALHISARDGSAHIVKCLVEAGCNVNLQNSNGKSPLHLAVQNRRKHVVKILLENKADVSLRDKQLPIDKIVLVRGKDKGKPAWHYVDVKTTLAGLFDKQIKSGGVNVAVFGTILASGWGTDPPDSKREQILKANSQNTIEIKDKTALHIACEISDEEIMELLVQYGADVNAQDADGFTPLQLATIRGNMNVVKKLIEHNADVNLTTADGKDAVDYAQMNEETEIEEFLKSKKSLFRKFWNRLSGKR